MSYDENYDDKIIKIKAEFINVLKKDLETISDEKIDRSEIIKSVYKFIFDKVGKGVKGKKEMKELFINFFINTVDFCLSYGFVIIDTLSELKEYQDFKMLKIGDEIDA